MMKIRMTMAAASLAVLAACGSHNSANNVEANADYNAALPDLNTLEMNATTDMNATGGTDLNAAGAGTGATGTTNANGNSTTNATTNY